MLFDFKQSETVTDLCKNQKGGGVNDVEYFKKKKKTVKQMLN